MPTSKKNSRLNKELTRAIADYLQVATLSEAAAQAHLFGTGAIAELEKKIASHYGMKYALCVSNATTGLFAIALALDLKDSEFITSPYTYGGSLASWLMSGCKPVFADIESLTLTLESKKVRQCVTSKTKAILTIDIFGNPSDTRPLRKLADDFGLWYIADCAQSFGAMREGFPASHLADALVISFTSGKTLFAGEGGAIITSNRGLYEKLLFYSQHPFRQKRELGVGISNEFAFNGRIHPLAAIWANEGFGDSLKRLRAYQDECLNVIDCLNKSGLTEHADFKAKDTLPSFFRLTTALKKGFGEREILNYLTAQGINAKTTSVPISVLYQNAVFLAQHEKQFVLPKVCSVAERQAKHRLGLALIKKGESGEENK